MNAKRMSRRGRFGVVLIILGIALIIWGVTSVKGLTPRERQLALHAKAQLDEAIADRAAGKAELEQAHIETKNANDVAQLAATSAQTAGERAKIAEDAAQKQHDELVRCAGENAKMREIVKAVSGPWWFPGLNALIYGIKKSVLSLLVIIAIVVVIGLLLKIFAPGVFAIFGVAGKAVTSFGGTAINSVKKLLPKRKTEPKD